MLRPTVSRPVCLGVKHPSGAYDQIFITVRQLRGCNVGRSLWRRTGLPFTIAAGSRQRTHSWDQVQRDSWPYFTVSDSRLPQHGGPGPRIFIPRNWVTQLYPQILGSLFVAVFDSQGYGGGIRTRLHVSMASVILGLSLYGLGAGFTVNTSTA
jgi:hypothetical protein